MKDILLVAFIGALVCTEKTKIKEEDGILVLTSENFEKAIDENKFLMVEFYAPWCGHCKALYPEYVQAADVLKEEKSQIKLAKIDATEHRDMQSKYEVGGYPTLKYFRSGKPIKYNGQRTADSIVEWLKKKAEPPAKSLSSLEEVTRFINGGEISIIGYFKDPAGFKAKNFIDVAESLDEHGFNFGISNEPLIVDDVKDGEIEVAGDHISLFKPFDEKRNDFKGKAYSLENIKTFIISHCLPTLIVYEPKYNRRIFDRSLKVGALWLALSSHNQEYSAQKEVARKIANENVGKFLTIIIDSKLEQNERFLELLGVKEGETAMRFAFGWNTNVYLLKYISFNHVQYFLIKSLYMRA